MQSFATILAQEHGQDFNAQGKDYIRRIITSAERLDRLIRDVLTYSRVVRSDTRLEPVHLHALLTGIVESYPAFHRPQAEITVDGELPDVLGNEAALTQCISNLLGNAVKFVAPGVIPKIRIWAEQRPATSSVRVFFHDNGIGIPETARNLVFGIFQRVSHDYEGTGIGLSIVKKAMHRMDGDVGYTSELGKGSTFWLELRAAATEPGN
jgi:signal transduction histidine kinase